MEGPKPRPRPRPPNGPHTTYMRFVPAHKQTYGDTASLTPAKWPVELVLISNEAGKQQFLDRERITHILILA